jgi:predicted DNA-binding transcriptional regulator
MLSSLFGSETRVRILNLLVLDSEKKCNLRELTKELKLGAVAIRKELTALTEFGLLKNEDDFWLVNKNFIIFSEIKALLIKAQILSSQKLIDGLKKIADLKYLALSGVFTSDAEAKTDIIIVGTIKRKPFLTLISALQIDLGREINYTIMDEAEFRYRQEVMDIFLYNALAGKIIVLVDNLNGEKK